MSQQRDIYRAPEGPPRHDPSTVDLRPTQARRRTIRSALSFTILMALLLAGAWGLVVFQGARSPSDDTAPDAADRYARIHRDAAEPDDEEAAGPVVAAPRLIDLKRAVESMGRGDGEPINPRKMAEAMGEVRIAKRHLDERHWEGASLHARKALDIWPEMNAALRILGFVYIQRGQFDQAGTVLNRALNDQPFSAETFNNLATAYFYQGQLEKAEEFLLTALKIEPDFLAAHLNLGLVYAMGKQYTLTLEHLERALDIDPGAVSARNNLAVALLRLGRYEEARYHLHEIVREAPGRPNPYFNMAITYVLEQDMGRAMEWLERGAEHCSPMACQRFLSDSDFDALRPHPEFQAFLGSLYPDVPGLPPVPGG